MAQGLCWLFAKLADLTCVVVSKSGKTALLQKKALPAWIRTWVPGLLRWAGHLKAGEEALLMRPTGAPQAFFPSGEGPKPLFSRAQFALQGALRVEFQPGAFAIFRARSLREAADFAFLRDCAES